MAFETLLEKLPYGKSFLFVDELVHIDANGAQGRYLFRADLPFYQDHFKDRPITPGVILTECCAQIGVVCLGLYLIGGKTEMHGAAIAFSSLEMEFLLPVYPGERVTVSSEKLYFRFNKLKCEVRMVNEGGSTVCKGVISGMFKVDSDG